MKMMNVAAPLAAIALLGTTSIAFGDPRAFVEPSAVPIGFGANHYIWSFGEGPGSYWGIENGGSADITAYTSLWNVGDQHTTSQLWDDLYANRVITGYVDIGGTLYPQYHNRAATADSVVQDGTATFSNSVLTARAPGYITAAGGYYAYTGDFGVTAEVANYGGADNARAGGTLVLMQVSTATNPDLKVYLNDGRFHSIGTPDNFEVGTGEQSGWGHGHLYGYDPYDIVITGPDGAQLNVPAEILDVAVLYQSSTDPSPHGAIPWQELLWTVWLPDYTGDFEVTMSVVNHGAFDALRIDTAIGSINGARDLSSFQVVPEPSAFGLLMVAAGAMLRRRRA